MDRSSIQIRVEPGRLVLRGTRAMPEPAESKGKCVRVLAMEIDHGEAITPEQLSGYYLASAVSADYGGMMIALPENEWTRRFASLPAHEFATHLRCCARHVRPDTFRKNVRGPKRPPPKRSSGAINHHVSTAKLLAEQK